MARVPPGTVNLSGYGLEWEAHIGQGHYGSVQLVREISTGRSWVAKAISWAGLNQKDHENVHQEVMLLQALRHPLIVAYHNSLLVDGMHTVVILMEHCVGGDLRQRILHRQQSQEWFPEDQVMAWFAQILLALQYMHSEKVLHRDLKTSNIFLIDASPTSMVKLGDFGISRVLEGTSDVAVSTVGTPYYMSPEVCRNEPYNWKSDVWALGCVLFEVSALKRAFESPSLAGLIYRIVNDRHNPTPEFYSKALHDLIFQLLSKSADTRPGLGDLPELPFVREHLQKQVIRAMAPESMPSAEEPRVKSQILAYRVASRLSTRQLDGQDSAFLPFVDIEQDTLSKTALQSSLLTLTLGLSEAEAATLAEFMAPEPSAQISIVRLQAALATAEAAHEPRQLAAWVRQVLELQQPVVVERLLQQDTRQLGILSLTEFEEVVMNLVPDMMPPQLKIIVLLVDKSVEGDIDYVRTLQEITSTESVSRDANGVSSMGPLPELPESPRESLGNLRGLLAHHDQAASGPTSILSPRSSYGTLRELLTTAAQTPKEGEPRHLRDL